MRKPKKHKSKFVFRKKSGKIIVQSNNNVWRRDIRSIVYMGDYGYHNDAHDILTVFHIPTGIDIIYVKEEKEARIIIKKLFVKLKRTKWEIKNPEPFDITIQLIDLALNISKILSIKPLLIQNKIFVSDDDVPF